MPDGGHPQDGADHLIREYHEHVARALVQYIAEGRDRRVRGDRHDDQLIVTFVLGEADVFQEYLEQLNKDRD